MRMMPRSLRFGLLLVVGIGLVPMVPIAPVDAAVTVDCSRHGQSIGRRLESAARTLDIIVKGDCVENVTIARDNVTLRTDGVTPASITAAPPALGETVDVVALDGARHVVIDGLTVKANGIARYGIVAANGSTLTLVHCEVHGAVSTGVIASKGSTASVDTCNVHDNGGSGVGIRRGSSATIVGSTLTDNGDGGIGGVLENPNTRIGVTDSETPFGNTIQRNTDGIGIHGASMAAIAANTISSNTRGINVGSGATLTKGAKE